MVHSDYNFTWEQFLSEVDDDMLRWGAAIEADTSNTLQEKKPTPTMSKSNQMSKNATSGQDKLVDKKQQPETPQDFIKSFEEKMNALKQKAATTKERVGNLIQSADEGNKQFLTNIDKQGYKLAEEAITVTNWTYGHNPQRYLHQRVIRLKGIIDSNVREIRKNADTLAESSILEKTNRDMEESVVRQMGAPSAIVTYRQFVVWLQTQFRGRKQERQIDPGESKACVKDMQEFSHIHGIFLNDIGAVDAMIRSLSTQVRPQLNSSSIDDVMKQKLLKRTDRMCKLVTMYLNSIIMSYRLHTEFVLNRRALMRRLYQK